MHTAVSVYKLRGTAPRLLPLHDTVVDVTVHQVLGGHEHNALRLATGQQQHRLGNSKGSTLPDERQGSRQSHGAVGTKSSLRTCDG